MEPKCYHNAIHNNQICLLFIPKQSSGPAVKHFLVFFFRSSTNDHPLTPGTYRFYYMAFQLVCYSIELSSIASIRMLLTKCPLILN